MGCAVFGFIAAIAVACLGFMNGSDTGIIFGIVVIGALALLVLAAIISANASTESRSRHEAFIKGKFPKFNQSVFYKDKAVMLDHETSRICVSDGNEYGILPLDRVFSVSLVIDNQEVANAGAIGGAVVGGVIAGGSGAIIGAMMAGPRKGKVKSIQLKVIVDTHDAPVITIAMYTGEGDVIDQQLKELTQSLADMIDVIRMAKARSAHVGQYQIERGTVALTAARPLPLSDIERLATEVLPAKPKPIAHKPVAAEPVRPQPRPQPPAPAEYLAIEEIPGVLVADVDGLRAAVAVKTAIVIQGMQANGSRMLIDAEKPSFSLIRDQCAKHGITQFTWKRFA